MTANTKTPVMVLQEFTVKKNLPSPEYAIVHARQGTHDNEFHYQVLAAGATAIGIGRSKQVAKHDAARKVLDKLEEEGIYLPDTTLIKAPRSEQPNSPIKLTINSIGSLEEVCVENKIPLPKFTQISDVGPPHCKEFTFECTIASLTTRATAGTKKQAKQLAAKEMLARLMNALPELVAECESSNVQAILDKDTVVKMYNYLTPFNKPKPNFSIKIEDYNKNLKNLMIEKGLEMNEFEKYFNGPLNEDSLKEFLSKFELHFAVDEIEKVPSLVTLTLNTDVPFAVIGIGDNYEIAYQNAIKKVFNYLEIYIR